MLKDILEKKIQQAFSPTYMDVINESYMHNVLKGSESHFKLVIVSEEFESKRLIARHRAVNSLLAEELANQIHALSMHTYTPLEWEAEQKVSPESPMCMGGNKK
ncbi:BolA/IbaG family iron-sulfur metabolism protein [Vibrio sp. ZSDE26]|uniref:DNA-binding transcriptional regulator BolA n=1 Tax=Vibrio amylolyticus TaxID=2847292 RepID=A0A9X1XNA2_9VIBR|nr:BolA/IbaG family iron-sulfur metabolism protein [Vibrio amylolyticus]MCK6262554.1 BolA/IbaG family iron-sulfur metabolism protein [Vibrio amylolyticus]